MIWKILDRAGTIAYLLLSTILITILMSNSQDDAHINNYGQKLDLAKKEALTAIENNVTYFEFRVNKLSETQDSYQVSTDQRVYILEQRVIQLQAEKKNTQKVIQNNFNTMTNN